MSFLTLKYGMFHSIIVFGDFLYSLVSPGVFSFSSLFRTHLKSKYSKVSYIFLFIIINLQLEPRILPTSYHKSVKSFASFLVLFLPSRHLFKVDYRDWARCKICSKLRTKTPERHQWCRSGVFIFNFEHISYFVLVLLLLTLSR